jgi:hypothetical protein
MGLLINDGLPGHGPAHTVTGHAANANGLLGISALPGTINKARANGDPRQCENMTCR